MRKFVVLIKFQVFAATGMLALCTSAYQTSLTPQSPAKQPQGKPLIKNLSEEKQMQGLSWSRLTRLEDLIEDWLSPTDTSPRQQDRPAAWADTQKAIMAIAHKLKGTLGRFGGPDGLVAS